jgi:hypothetical protein
MTDVERAEIDANNLWTLESEIKWYLDQNAGRDVLATSSEIAAELRATPTSVLAILRRLQEKGAVSGLKTKRGERWGTQEHVDRIVQARRQTELDRATAIERIIDQNDALEEIRVQLEDVVAGHKIEVTSLMRIFPTSQNEDRRDHLVLTTGDLATASWILARLRNPAPAEWAEHLARLDDLLSSLERAGWFLDEDGRYHEYDPEVGPVLSARLSRKGTAFNVEYLPSKNILVLQPWEDLADDPEESFSIIDDEVVIELTGDCDEQQRTVTERVAGLGLLDPTHSATAVRAADGESALELGDL